MNIYQRETVEFQVATVEVDGTALTIADVADVELQITGQRERPADADWAAPIVLGDAFGVMVDGPALGPGTYLVWAKVISYPETPVLEAGSFRVA